MELFEWEWNMYHIHGSGVVRLPSKDFRGTVPPSLDVILSGKQNIVARVLKILCVAWMKLNSFSVITFHTEISNFQNTVRIYEEVMRFQITMNTFWRVYEYQCLQNLRHEELERERMSFSWTVKRGILQESEHSWVVVGTEWSSLNPCPSVQIQCKRRWNCNGSLHSNDRVKKAND